MLYLYGVTESAGRFGSGFESDVFTVPFSGMHAVVENVSEKTFSQGRCREAVFVSEVKKTARKQRSKM